MDASKVKLSALWAVVMLNMAFADIVGFLSPGTLRSILDGAVGFEATPALLLVFSVLLEVPIAMVFLSLVLPAAANRWLSTVAAAVTTAFVVAGGSATPSYAFFATVEVAVMAAIVLYAWRTAHAPVRSRRSPL